MSEQKALWFPAVIAGMDFSMEQVNSEILNCFLRGRHYAGIMVSKSRLDWGAP